MVVCVPSGLVGSWNMNGKTVKSRLGMPIDSWRGEEEVVESRCKCGCSRPEGRWLGGLCVLEVWL
jgi:hypothetical protein